MQDKRESHRHRGPTHGCQGGKGQGGVNWEIGTDICTLLYIRWMTNRNLLCGTGNSTQCCVVTYMGKESKKEWLICICVTGSLCCAAETGTTL